MQETIFLTGKRRVLRLLFALVSGSALLLLLLWGLSIPLPRAAPAATAAGAPSPVIGVNYAHNWVEVTQAAANTAITITVADKGEVNGVTDDNGYFQAGGWDPPIEPGDVVTVENLANVRSLTVGEIAGAVDYDADKVRAWSMRRG